MSVLRPLAALALLLAGCAAPSLAGRPDTRMALGPAGGGASDVASGAASRRPTAPGTITLTLGGSRSLNAAARTWKAADVFQYDLALAAYDPVTETFASLPEAAAVVLPQKPVPLMQATFAGLAADGRYRVTVTARGNAGGTAAEQVLNAASPAVVEFDLADLEAPRERTIAVPLDPVPFSVEVRLPTTAGGQDVLPAWLTGFSARLLDPARPGTPVATASWAPSKPASFTNVRGDTAYDLELDVKSAAGSATARLPGFRVARAEGAEQVVTPAFTIVPPTGTLLATHTLLGGAFGVAIDKADRVWVTNQTGDSATVMNFEGVRLVTPNPAVFGQPRAIAADPDTGDVWVAALNAGRLSRFNGPSTATATYSAGFFPSGVAVAPDHRVWVANLLSGTAQVLATDGTVQGTFTVGASPAAVVVDRGNGDVWVGNVDGNSVSRISGGVATTYPLPANTKPAGIAVAEDHTLWVVGNTSGKLHHVAANGAILGTPITAGAGATAIAIDPASGALWVGLPNGQQVAKHAPDGTRIGAYRSGAFPNSIAVDRRGHVWVAGGGKLSEHAP